MKKPVNSTTYYQQGDVILRKVDSLPEGLTEVKDHKILQNGETTGHMHQFGMDQRVLLFVDPTFKDDSKRITPLHRKFIMVEEQSALTHQEHNTLIIAKGIYEIDIVREYDYEANETRRVVD